MNNDKLWQLFYDTGDPLSWLYYRAAEKSKDIDGAGEESRP